MDPQGLVEIESILPPRAAIPQPVRHLRFELLVIGIHLVSKADSRLQFSLFTFSALVPLQDCQRYPGIVDAPGKLVTRTPDCLDGTDDGGGSAAWLNHAQSRLFLMFI